MEFAAAGVCWRRLAKAEGIGKGEWQRKQIDQADEYNGLGELK